MTRRVLAGLAAITATISLMPRSRAADAVTNAHDAHVELGTVAARGEGGALVARGEVGALAADKLKLSSEALDTATRETIRSGYVDHDGKVIEDRKLSDVFNSLGKKTSAPSVGEIEDAFYQARFSDARDRTERVKRELIMKDKVLISAGAWKSLDKDLALQTNALAKSGIPAEKIAEQNSLWMSAALKVAKPTHGTGPKTLSLTTYATWKDMFPKFTKVTIRSVPPGASVTVDGVAIGTTEIREKAFDPGGKHALTFELAGYQAATRLLVVSASAQLQVIEEVLIPLLPR